jgi:hypothetical protein
MGWRLRARKATKGPERLEIAPGAKGFGYDTTQLASTDRTSPWQAADQDLLNISRFNRRKSASRGKLFFRLAQHALQIALTTYERLVRPQDVEIG